MEPQTMEKTEISKNTPLEPGDEIEIVYRTRGWILLTALQLLAIENKLAGLQREGWSYQSSRWDREGQRLYINVLIIETNPIEVTAGLIIIAIATVAGGLFLWLSLDKIYKITKSPAGGISVGLILVAIFLFVLKALK